jgi:predicted RNA-binding Zn-ribbon protein involved in translation (DUF1610 family)
MKLKWKNLNSNLCPQCGKPLTVMTKNAFCIPECGFNIWRDKMEQIKYNIANGIYQGRRNFEQGRG